MRITESKKITDFFGCNVFNDGVMQKYMPRETYNELKEVTDLGKPLNKELANKVAKAMKEWAGDMGATHYTHWFQPLTGTTAEKHDQAMARIQNMNFITNLAYFALLAGQEDLLPFLTPSFRRRRNAARKMLTEDAQLFAGLFEANPHSHEAVRQYRQMLNLAAAGDIDLLCRRAQWWWNTK